MSPKQRKKEPPDPSPSLFVLLVRGRLPSSLAVSLIFAESSSRRASYIALTLYHCSVNSLFSDLLFSQIPDLGLHVLDGTRSSVSVGSCGWSSLRRGAKPSDPQSTPHCLSSLASLCLNPSRSGRHPAAPSSGQLGRGRLSEWRLVVFLHPNFGVVDLVLGKSISLVELAVRSVCYEVVSHGINSTSGLVCTLSHLRRFASAPGRPNSPQAVIPLIRVRSALVVSYCHNRQGSPVYIVLSCLLVLSPTQLGLRSLKFGVPL
uniref:Uncharacterized protein n=1 Tax=Opuntia streptacantha TaxID=393608 RepID=A0A7C9AMS5_OPUST